MTENPDFVVNRVDDHQANPLEGYLPKSGGTVTGDLEVNGTQELNGISVARRTVSATAPGSPEDGDLWVDSSTPAWVYPTLGNSWVSFGGTLQTARFFKDASGVVHLQGTIANGTANTTIFTLPTGYRPTARLEIATYAYPGMGKLNIDSNGVVQFDAWVISSGSNAAVALSGITFATF